MDFKRDSYVDLLSNLSEGAGIMTALGTLQRGDPFPEREGMIKALSESLEVSQRKFMKVLCTARIACSPEMARATEAIKFEANGNLLNVANGLVATASKLVEIARKDLGYDFELQVPE